MDEIQLIANIWNKHLSANANILCMHMYGSDIGINLISIVHDEHLIQNL